MSPRTPEEALAFLASLPPSRMRLGLERVRAALSRLSHPERAYRALQVAGTNGKGSTCALAAACLSAQGYRVGLYTSPHLLRVNERIRVDGVEISDGLLGQRTLEVLERCPADELTYFEVGTLVALWHFARERVDIAVLETGLGGRLDATTAACPEVTAITPISFDHQEHLGDTLAAIAREKAGILKPGVPVAIARQPEEALSEIERAARELGAPLVLEGRDFSLTREGGRLAYRGLGAALDGLELSLRGEHQLQNAAVALAALELLCGRGFSLSPESLRAGLSSTLWPGRLEERPGRPTILLDGAHNPAGAEALARALDGLYAGRRCHLVFGVLADKARRPMMQALFPRCASVHLALPDSPRALAPERYLDEARALAPAEPHPSVAQALRAACSAAAGDDLVVCAGSLYLLGEVRRVLEAGGRG